MRVRILMFAFAIVALAMGGFVACSSETEATKTEVKLPTIQCGACEHTISTALKGVDGVKDVKIDLKKKTAEVTFAANQATVSKIETTIVNAGYAANDKKADAKAYANLPDCCKVEGH